ncbi:YaiI/YqxD family protein [Indiicoccus explosivorum]|uniref:YaiI/YqxD family protein n=1 Tax=Indiicoccus explosivorum TaxID=1917864 RepID=UPI000B43B4B9|nr:YaiI/YqxD family protein [Indiicoccus explosivorum]
MKILIDADGCPVTAEAIDAAREAGIPVLLFCDTAHIMQREGAETITVPKGADAADFVLVNRVEAGDVVVTQDYGLAAMALAKRGVPIDQNGRVYTENNIDLLLFSRHEAKKFRQAGGRTKGPKKRRAEDDRRFTEALRPLLGLRR